MLACRFNFMEERLHAMLVSISGLLLALVPGSLLKNRRRREPGTEASPQLSEARFSHCITGITRTNNTVFLPLLSPGY